MTTPYRPVRRSPLHTPSLSLYDVALLAALREFPRDEAPHHDDWTHEALYWLAKLGYQRARPHRLEHASASISTDLVDRIEGAYGVRPRLTVLGAACLDRQGFAWVRGFGAWQGLSPLRDAIVALEERRLARDCRDAFRAAALAGELETWINVVCWHGPADGQRLSVSPPPFGPIPVPVAGPDGTPARAMYVWSPDGMRAEMLQLPQKDRCTERMWRRLQREVAQLEPVRFVWEGA